jgi:hypothetical protein
MSSRRLSQYVQRRIGLSLAESENAAKTSQAISDPDCCFEDILTTAADEIGIDKLAAHVLNNDPEWAYRTLRHVPDLGSHRDALIAKAAESPEWALHTLRFVPDLGSSQGLVESRAGVLAQSQGNISGFNLLDQGWYNYAFTMYWIHQGVEYGPDLPNKKYAAEISGGGGPAQAPCLYFPDDPRTLQAGDSVWMFNWIRASTTDCESALRFTYDPTTTNYAYFTATGSVDSPSLALINLEPYNPALPHGA